MEWNSQIEPVYAIAPFVFPLIMAGLQAGSQLLQNRSNKKIVDSQNRAQRQMQSEMLEYNLPINQRDRMVQAGYNPNLFYGQGNPGNQTAPTEVAKRPFINLESVVPLINQSRLVQSQTAAQDATTINRLADTNLKKQQQLLVQRNPLMNDTVLESMVSSWKSAAEIKATESNIKANDFAQSFMRTQWFQEYGMQKMNKELDLLTQKFNLNSADLKIKAEVLNSKEFQNQLLEVQKKFMVDGELNAQHMVQFISLLMMKML